MEEFSHYLPLRIYVNCITLRQLESFKFNHDTLFYRELGFQKCFFFNFSPFFWKNQKFYFSFKVFILDKKSEVLLTYTKYQCLQSKKYKIRDQCLRKLSKKILNFLGVLRGKLTLAPPPLGIPAPSLGLKHK